MDTTIVIAVVDLLLFLAYCAVTGHIIFEAITSYRFMKQEQARDRLLIQHTCARKKEEEEQKKASALVNEIKGELASSSGSFWEPAHEPDEEYLDELITQLSEIDPDQANALRAQVEAALW